MRRRSRTRIRRPQAAPRRRRARRKVRTRIRWSWRLRHREHSVPGPAESKSSCGRLCTQDFRRASDRNCSGARFFLEKARILLLPRGTTRGTLVGTTYRVPRGTLVLQLELSESSSTSYLEVVRSTSNRREEPAGVQPACRRLPSTCTPSARRLQ